VPNFDPEEKIDCDSDEDPVQKSIESLFNEATTPTKNGNMC
jgi:hypothetical protein